MKRLLYILLVLTLTLPLSGATPFTACPDALVQRLLADTDNYYVPHFIRTADAERPEQLFILSHTQNTVSEPDKIEAFKRDMREGRFRYESAEGRIGGHYHERRRIFFVGEGHHRLAAALEIAKEDGDWRPFKNLVRHGIWEKFDRKPVHQYRLPVRSTWRNALSWRAFLAPFSPSN